MATLRRTIHLHDDTGELHTFLPGDAVPEWVARRITNPAVWADGGGYLASNPGPVAPEDAGPGGAGGPASSPPDEPGSPAVSRSKNSSSGEPPRSGPGSNRRAWADYANTIGVEYDVTTDGRDAIIAAVDARWARARL